MTLAKDLTRIVGYVFDNKNHTFVRYNKSGYYSDNGSVYRCTNCNCGLYISNYKFNMIIDVIFFWPDFNKLNIHNLQKHSEKYLSCDEMIIKNIIE